MKTKPPLPHDSALPPALAQRVASRGSVAPGAVMGNRAFLRAWAARRAAKTAAFTAPRAR
jgi:hypothetical protein